MARETQKVPTGYIRIADLAPTTLLAILGDNEVPPKTSNEVWEQLVAIVGRKTALEMVPWTKDLSALYKRMFQEIDKQPC